MVLSVNNLTGFGASRGGIYLMDVIRAQSLTSSLLYCVDVADPASYQGGQTLLDLSGNGNNFVLGATSGAESSDLVFYGIVGEATEGTYLEPNANSDIITNETNGVPDTLGFNRNNAKWTVVGIYYASTGGQQSIIPFANCDIGSTSTRGMYLEANSSEAYSIIYYCRNNTLGVTDTFPSSGTKTSLNKGTWNFIAFSLDEAATTITIYINGTSNSHSINAMSATNNYTNVTSIFGANYAGVPYGANTGTRFAANACWNGINLTTVQLDSLRTEMKKRFPSIP